MVRAEITIPAHDNNYKATPTHLIHAWCQMAFYDHGGCTWKSHAGVGYFKGVERAYEEPVGVLSIDIKDGLHARGQVLRLARLIKVALDQESVYVCFTAVDAVLV